MTIGKTIKFYRKERELTQSELAELIGVSTQAISKWETEVGLPDISQIVPLSRVLEISTDKLLGVTDSLFEEQVAKIRSMIGGINFVSDVENAEQRYELTCDFVEKYPDVPDVAVACLDSYIELFSKGRIELPNSEFLEQCERYAANIFRFETDTDRIYKTNYLMSRAYGLCGEDETSQSYLQNMPIYFGLKDYWEAEVACLNKDYERASLKNKQGFAHIARFAARSVRLQGKIIREQNKENAKEISLELDEYMLRLINAFISGGDYMPYRQIFQKTALLTGLVLQNVKVGNIELAKEHFKELTETRNAFLECVENTDNKDSLMFIKGDLDGAENATKEKIDQRIVVAKEGLKNYM